MEATMWRGNDWYHGSIRLSCHFVTDSGLLLLKCTSDTPSSISFTDLDFDVPEGLIFRRT